MGLFGRGKGGGLMNIIRCDLEDYLVWKWRPADQEVNSTTRENSIRWNSSLRVKEGEVAVFVYKQNNGTLQDFIEGPFDQTIKTANFPILASLAGMAFGGESPFQAEIYFINCGSTIQIKFGVPYFDVIDPRFLDLGVPCSAGGTITFGINDYKEFIKMNRLVDFSLTRLQDKVKDVIVRRTKAIIANAPIERGIPVVQIERKIEDINEAISAKLVEDFKDFGISIKRFDLSRISMDKDSDAWTQLRSVTADIQTQTIKAQSDVNIRNLYDMQEINSKNMSETMRIQREEAQRAQRLQTENAYMGAHALNVQADVLKAGMNNLGEMSNMNIGNGSGGMNPVGMMTGMAMGASLGSQMGGMMQNMGQQMNASVNDNQPGAMNGMMPPPIPGTPQPGAVPNVMFMVAIGTQQAGPFNMMQLQQLAAGGQLRADTLVWRQGMSVWTPAGQTPELAPLFATAAMQQGMPPVPGAGTPMPPPMP